MMHENDKFIIPEKYREMSVSELRSEQERVYKTLEVQKAANVRKKLSEGTIVFNF